MKVLAHCVLIFSFCRAIRREKQRHVRWEFFNNCFNFGIYSCFTILQKFAITGDKKTMNSFKANFKIIVYLADLFENSFEKCSSEFQNFSKIWNEVKWIVFTFSTDTFLWFIVINQVFSFSKSCIPSQKHWIVQNFLFFGISDLKETNLLRKKWL